MQNDLYFPSKTWTIYLLPVSPACQLHYPEKPAIQNTSSISIQHLAMGVVLDLVLLVKPLTVLPFTHKTR